MLKEMKNEIGNSLLFHIIDSKLFCYFLEYDSSMRMKESIEICPKHTSTEQHAAESLAVDW